MNNNETSSSFELPSVPEQSNVPQEQSVENTPEVGLESYVAPAAPVASQPLVSNAPQSDTVDLSSDPVDLLSAPTGLSSDPVIADDNDLIEKEWVMKAKQIVAATKDDPHRQSLELSKFKADYIKKRYGKDIKIGEA